MPQWPCTNSWECPVIFMSVSGSRNWNRKEKKKTFSTTWKGYSVMQEASAFNALWEEGLDELISLFFLIPKCFWHLNPSACWHSIHLRYWQGYNAHGMPTQSPFAGGYETHVRSISLGLNGASLENRCLWPWLMLSFALSSRTQGPQVPRHSSISFLCVLVIHKILRSIRLHAGSLQLTLLGASLLNQATFVTVAQMSQLCLAKSLWLIRFMCNLTDKYCLHEISKILALKKLVGVVNYLPCPNKQTRGLNFSLQADSNHSDVIT